MYLFGKTFTFDPSTWVPRAGKSTNHFKLMAEIKTNRVPTYSDNLIALSRAFDRAMLANKAVQWHLSSLESDGSEYDDDLAEYAQNRLDLLEEALPDMRTALYELIRRESAPYFDIEVNDAGEIIMPAIIKELINPFMEAEHHECHFRFENKDVPIEKWAKNHQVISFEGNEFYLLPKDMPPGIIEIWVRRWFSDSYALCLVKNPKYGWDIFGHER